MREIEYNRNLAVSYARKWAFSRNPAYYDFDGIGGDCTNFASQCLYAGVDVMNYTPDLGWYYNSPTDRSAGWTGVEYFYNFLIANAQTGVGTGAGPFAKLVGISELQIGDFIQLGRETGDFYHTPVVVGFTANGVPLVAAHTNDAYGRALSSYSFERLRCIRILGGRVE